MQYNYWLYKPKNDDLDVMQNTDELLDADGISDWEEGFMRGAKKAEV